MCSVVAKASFPLLAGLVADDGLLLLPAAEYNSLASM